ncbi:arabinan endo-1,5-alpha-L-arabinosidase [Catalinimonas niigatensis]|uniref:arabinan endo-1,5-alpha-L-arabinosidase n=1 Tax=Catalinimonas niigatensis TaxID=1397264 RepID=UPI0026652D32|nr:arabinan endo-1,5-alpha-L-arabinosidase [Catalinimonas niigatensis]WPP52108.1 arabinan endo-1,5-alpha-L-arabinosidase [Catalinimonas niigatensis]
MGLLLSCREDDPPALGPIQTPDTTRIDTTRLDDGPVDFSQLADTYGQLASPDLVYQWAHYNSHDPSILKEGRFFYSYGTDVAFGHEIRPGIQIRRSINLVEWEFVGWVFNTLPPEGARFIRQNGGEPNNSLWAPYIQKVGDEYRLYYSLASNTPRLSVIGLATSDDPRGPFRERGVVVTSQDNNSIQTNAIDPSVIIDQNGKHWMYYGSAWDGIYVLELDPDTGLAVRNGDKGKRIAQRAFTGGRVNGNIEGPEITYNETFNKYYLFIAYDWLETKYNVRVGRADQPEGPFYDYLGRDMNQENDDVPMILAPYQFSGHSGWQGVSHPAVFAHEGQYYMAHQGRPGANPFYMVLHVRQMYWTEEGWPLVSPQRYAAEEESPVEESELIGQWEQIVLGYQVVPGYAEEQISPDFQTSVSLTLDIEGTLNGDESNSWIYEAPWLTLNWNNTYIDKLYVERGRDWENEIESTILFTGLNQEGTAIWGKKTE